MPSWINAFEEPGERVGARSPATRTDYFDLDFRLTSAEAAAVLDALLYRLSRRTFDAVEAAPEDVRTLFFFAIVSPPSSKCYGEDGARGWRQGTRR